MPKNETNSDGENVDFSMQNDNGESIMEFSKNSDDVEHREANIASADKHVTAGDNNNIADSDNKIYDGNDDGDHVDNYDGRLFPVFCFLIQTLFRN